MLFNILYEDHVTDKEVCREIQVAIGEHDKLLTLVKKRKLRWFCNGFYFRFSFLPEYREISLLLFVLFTSGSGKRQLNSGMNIRSFICKY